MLVNFILNNITIITVGCFLFITLVVGLKAGKGIKTLREYAIADRKYGTGVLVLTFLATTIGGSGVIGIISEVYSQGIIVSLTCLGFGIRFLLFALIISPRIIRFKNALTIGDIVEEYFGKEIKILTGILTFIYSICIISLQLIIFGDVCESLVGVKASYAIIVSGLILGIYSVFGGIKSVTVTDVIQFIVLIVAIPMIAIIAINKAGGLVEIFSNIPKEKFQVLRHKKLYYYLTIFVMWGIFPDILVNPPSIQRLLMASSKAQIRKKFLIMAVFSPFFRLTLTLTAFAAIIIFPNMSSPIEIVPKLITEFMPIGLKGIAISGILAVIMSTADSYLNAAGILFSNDIIKPIYGYFKKSFNELLFARIFTFLAGVLSIFLTLKAEYFMDLQIYSSKAVIPIFFPVLCAILGIKSDKTTFIIGLFGLIITYFFTATYLPKDMQILAIPLGIIGNAIIFLSVHYIKNKGFVILKNEEDYGRPQEKVFFQISNLYYLI